MHVQTISKLFKGIAAVAVMSSAMVQYAGAQAAGAKNWKPGEYEMYTAAGADINANKGADALAKLDQWKQKFPQSDYKDEFTNLYVSAYAASNEFAKAVDAAADLVNRGVDSAFPDPKTGPPMALAVLFKVVTSVQQLKTPTPEEMATGEKAAHQLESYSRMPDGMQQAQWDQAKGQLQTAAKGALQYLVVLPGRQAQDKKDWPACEDAYAKAVKAYPENAWIAFQYASCIYQQVKEKPEKRSFAVYEFQRAVVQDASLGGSADAARMKTYADNTYINMHGSDEGLPALKESVKANPLPPDGFKIKTATEVAEEKQKEFETSNPLLANWMKIKGVLADTNGQQVFDSQIKDAAVPKLRGTIVDLKPTACNPKELIVAVPLPDAKMTPEITIKIGKVEDGKFAPELLRGKPELNSEIKFDKGIGQTFKQDPFMLTLAVEKANIEDLKVSPCTPTAPGTKKGAPTSKKK
jgi:hypothetical protein